MDDDFDFDESLFQAVDQLESNYKSQAAARGHQNVHCPQQNICQHAAYQPVQQAPRQPLQQANQTGTNLQNIWSLFSSLQPVSAGGSVTSVCSGWANRRLQQRPRYAGGRGTAGSGHKGSILMQQQANRQQPQQWASGPTHTLHQQPPQQQRPLPQQQGQPGLQQYHLQQPMQNCQLQQQQQQHVTTQPLQWQPMPSAPEQQRPQGQQHSRQEMQTHHAQPYQPQQQHHTQQHVQQPRQCQQQAAPASAGAAAQQHMPGCQMSSGCQQGGMNPASGSDLGCSMSGAARRSGHAADHPPPAGAAAGGAALSGPHAGPSGMGPPPPMANTAPAAATAPQQSGPVSSPTAAAGCSGAAAACSGMGGTMGAAAGGASGSAAAPGVSGGNAAVAGASGGPARPGALCVYSAKLHLGPKGMIEVEFSGYHQDISTICGSIPGAKQVGDRWSRKWHIPTDKMQQLEAKLKDGATVRVPKFDQLAEIVCKFITAARKQPDDSERYERLGQLQLAPGESLEQRMMPFQREGVRFGLRAGGRVLIGDEMGLGKTVQACAMAKCYQDEWPALVVAPSSLRLSWQAALYDWIRVVEDRVLVVLKKTDMNRLANAKSEEEARSMFDFVVVSYDMLKDMSEVLQAMDFNVVILDESHCIKNPTAQRTKLALPLVKKAKRCIMLSGTPALSRPTELFTQLQGLIPKAGLTKKAFEDRYAVYSNYGNFPKLTGSKNEDELNKLLTSTVMVRRKKQEVLKDLPAKLRKQVLLVLPPKKRAQLDGMKQKLSEVRQLAADIHGLGHEVGGGLLQGMQQQQRNMIMELYHNMASVKADTVAEYVTELLDNAHPDDKFLIFAYHKEMMDTIECAVSNVKRKNKEIKDLRHMRIDGSTPAHQRQKNVEQFQEDENCRVAILNIKAAGVGLTLTRASTVVFAELAWTPSEVQQAEDRAHRIGQTNCVNVQLLLVKDSIDEVMWELLQSKLATTGQVLDGQKDRMEVDKSAQHRAKTGWTMTQQDSTQAENQPSIKDFFGAASKKQRLS